VDPLTHNFEQRALQSVTDACTWRFGFVAYPTIYKFTNLRNILSDYLSARSFDQAPSHCIVHSLCHAPARVPPPVLDALGLGLGYNLSLQRKDEIPINFDRFGKDIHT
jgi:hypothetical protein